jgi:hypothetical protein
MPFTSCSGCSIVYKVEKDGVFADAKSPKPQTARKRASASQHRSESGPESGLSKNSYHVV